MNRSARIVGAAAIGLIVLGAFGKNANAQERYLDAGAIVCPDTSALSEFTRAAQTHDLQWGMTVGCFAMIRRARVVVLEQLILDRRPASRVRILSPIPGRSAIGYVFDFDINGR